MRLPVAPWLILLAGAMAPGGTPAADDTADAVARGEYLVNLLGCGRCHTEGYLIGNRATGPALAGSRVGIAYTEAPEGQHPGLVFAPNLTPDDATGLGRWSVRDITRTLMTGVGRDGHQRLTLMPWPNYGALDDGDLEAIARYLKSLRPVARQIPPMTAPGATPEHPYVRFGVYVFTPFEEGAAPAPR